MGTLSKQHPRWALVVTLLALPGFLFIATGGAFALFWWADYVGWAPLALLAVGMLPMAGAEAWWVWLPSARGLGHHAASGRPAPPGR